MKVKFFTLLLAFFAATSISAQTNKDYKSELDLIFKAFKEKKYDPIKSLLDPNVKIGDLPTGMNDMIMPQLLEQLPQTISYKVIKTTKVGENTRVETVYVTKEEPKIERNFTFNKNGKIIDFDVLGDAIMQTQKDGE